MALRALGTAGWVNSAYAMQLYKGFGLCDAGSCWKIAYAVPTRTKSEPHFSDAFAKQRQLLLDYGSDWVRRPTRMPTRSLHGHQGQSSLRDIKIPFRISFPPFGIVCAVNFQFPFCMNLMLSKEAWPNQQLAIGN